MRQSIAALLVLATHIRVTVAVVADLIETLTLLLSLQLQMAVFRLLVKHARQIVMVCNKGQPALRGQDMKQLAVLTNSDQSSSTGYSLIVDHNGTINAIGPDEEIEQTFSANEFTKVIDATDMCVLPGLSIY